MRWAASPAESEGASGASAAVFACGGAVAPAVVAPAPANNLKKDMVVVELEMQKSSTKAGGFQPPATGRGVSAMPAVTAF